MNNIVVNYEAFKRVMNALLGPDHHIRELQATRSLPNNPINILVADHNAAVGAHNALHKE